MSSRPKKFNASAKKETPASLGKLLLAECSCPHPDFQLIDDLIARGADIEYREKPDGVTPFIAATMRNNGFLMNKLQKAGVDINAVSRGGSALAIAVTKNQGSLTQYLLNCGANPDVPGLQGKTALIWAVQLERRHLIHVLLAHKANPFVKDDDGKTALDHARKNGPPDIILLMANAEKKRIAFDQEREIARREEERRRAEEERQRALEAQYDAGMPLEKPLTLPRRITVIRKKP